MRPFINFTQRLQTGTSKTALQQFDTGWQKL